MVRLSLSFKKILKQSRNKSRYQDLYAWDIYQRPLGFLLDIIENIPGEWSGKLVWRPTCQRGFTKKSCSVRIARMGWSTILKYAMGRGKELGVRRLSLRLDILAGKGCLWPDDCSCEWICQRREYEDTIKSFSGSLCDGLCCTVSKVLSCYMLIVYCPFTFEQFQQSAEIVNGQPYYERRKS